jgi:hypothetical protein
MRSVVWVRLLSAPMMPARRPKPSWGSPWKTGNTDVNALSLDWDVNNCLVRNSLLFLFSISLSLSLSSFSPLSLSLPLLTSLLSLSLSSLSSLSLSFLSLTDSLPPSHVITWLKGVLLNYFFIWACNKLSKMYVKKSEYRSIFPLVLNLYSFDSPALWPP